MKISRVLEVAEDLAHDGQGAMPEVREWAMMAQRAYLKAGCKAGAIVDRIPHLIELFVKHLEFTRGSYQASAKDPRSTTAEQTADLFFAKVAGELLERIRREARR